MFSILLLGVAQSAASPADVEAQRIVEAMVASTNAAPPPGVKGASAGPRMLILHLQPPAAVGAAIFADMFQKGSVGAICSDPGMRLAADVHQIRFRISVEPIGQSRAVTREITSASCAAIPAPPRPGAAGSPAGAGATPADNRGAMIGDELEALARHARAFSPRDQFDASPAMQSVNGKRFSYTVTPLQTGPDNVICSGYPNWGYWPQDARLEVSAGLGTGIKSNFAGKTEGRMFPSTPGVSEFSAFVTFHSLSCEKTRLPSYTATNRFGAQMTVFKSREVVTAVGEFGMPDTKWKNYWTTQVSGEEARQLSRNVRIRMSGTLRDWAPGKPVLCGRKSSAPTTQLPYDETTEICMFNGRPDLFEVLDARTGKVLHASRR